MAVLKDVVMNESFSLPRRFLMTAGELLTEVIAPLTSDHFRIREFECWFDNVT